MKGKTLIAYFSAEGTTAAVADILAKTLHADLFAIRPAAPYTAEDLNWMNKNSRSSVEMADPDARPALKETADISAYDTVLIGFPIWWYVEPRIVDTFLDGALLTGKTLIPFATSGGSGIEKAQTRLKTLYPQANWQPGKLLTAGSAAAWAKQL